MTKADFRSFLQSRKASAVDWDARRAEWLHELESLYSKVSGWLDEFAADGVTYDDQTIVLDEEHLGRYHAPALRISCRGTDVWMEPVGANIIGARGRVDLKGFGGAARLLLVPANADLMRARETGQAVAGRRPEPGTGQAVNHVWKKATPPPDVRYVELTEEVFLDTLKQVVDAGSG